MLGGSLLGCGGLSGVEEPVEEGRSGRFGSDSGFGFGIESHDFGREGFELERGKI